MSASAPDARASTPPGLIDTIQAGFTAVNRNFWLLALPIAIDVVLWLGPQVAPGGLVERWLVDIANPAVVDETTMRTLQERRTEIQQLGLSRFNLLWLVALPMFGASFRAGLPGTGPFLIVQSPSAAAAVLLASAFAGLLVSALFFGLLGQAVREGRAALRGFLPDYGRIALHLAGLSAVFLVLSVSITIPAALLLAVSESVSPLFASIVAPALAGVFLWALIYLFFTPDALFVSRCSALQAIQNSIRVVRYNFWATLAFIGLVVVIWIGLAIVWQRITTNTSAGGGAMETAGVLVSILGHIYISSGLAAATMTYYSDKLSRLSATA